MAKLEIYDAQDAIPEAFREHYVERDGKWYPDAPELYESGRAAIDKERRTASENKKRADAAEKALKALQAEVEELKATPPPAAEAAAGDHAKQLAQVKKEFEEFRKALEQKAAESEKRAADLALRDQQRTIADTLRNAALEVGVRKEAVNDLITLGRFKDAWRMNEAGELMAYDGDTPILDPITTKPISAKSYAEKFVNEPTNSYWLPPSSGGGAQGNGAARPGGVVTVKKSDLQEASDYKRITEDAAKRGAIVQYTDT